LKIENGKLKIEISERKVDCINLQLIAQDALPLGGGLLAAGRSKTLCRRARLLNCHRKLECNQARRG